MNNWSRDVMNFWLQVGFGIKFNIYTILYIYYWMVGLLDGLPIN
jgi:hypothetical protein